MKKVLIVATLSTFIAQFEKNDIHLLQDMGYEVHCAANFQNDKGGLDNENIIKHPIDIQRSPYSIKNLKAYKQLKELIQYYKYDLIHCHTPMGGVLGRLAAQRVGINLVMYTAHGFHFYKKSPILNWIIYYPIEKYLARYTDILITINNEDYTIAQKFKMKKNGKVYYLPGVGIQTEKFCTELTKSKKEKCKELNIPNEPIIILSVGELIKRKNHQIVINAIKNLTNQNIIYLICGEGKLKYELNNLIYKLNLEEKVFLLGYRQDIIELCRISDIFIFPSLQEGLPVALMEAMAAGLPVICSDIRGNQDLVENNINGFLFKKNDIKKLEKDMDDLINNVIKRKEFSSNNLNKIKQFDIKNVEEKMKMILNEMLKME